MLLALLAAPARASRLIAPCSPGGNGSSHGMPCTGAVTHGSDAIVGCLSPFATNYNPAARIDSGRCQYAIDGCMDSRALNFNPEATHATVICVMRRVGCMARSALNYDLTANVHESKLCDMPSAVRASRRRGCLLSEALNYDPFADEDGGNCLFQFASPMPRAAAVAHRDRARMQMQRAPVTGCMDPLADNFAGARSHRAPRVVPRSHA